MFSYSCIRGNLFVHSWQLIRAFVATYSCICGNLFVHSWQLIRAFVATYSCIRGNKFFHSKQILFLLLNKEMVSSYLTAPECFGTNGAYRNCI